MLRQSLRSAAIMLVVFVSTAVARAAEPLEIVFVDVMGGAATLIKTPEGQTILLDSGWPGLDDRDPKRIVYVLKEVLKKEKLDYLLSTHWHTDHYGGVEGLAKRIEIGQFLDRGLPEDPGADPENFPDGPKADDKLGIAYRKAAMGKRTVLKAGDTIPLKGDLKVQVLAASGRVMPAPAGAKPNPLCETAPADKPKDGSDNALSIVTKFSLGKFDFFDAGDLTWNIEKQLVCPINLVGVVDLYQVTHHGMDISNHPTLMKSLDPSVAIMNNGPRKGGSAATVKWLRELQNLKGAYALHRNVTTTEAENLPADVTANKDTTGGEFIRVTVSPDGSGYSVRIGAYCKETRYESK
jgi:beta-lactamase superfamily II metal-dependent hydrolase